MHGENTTNVGKKETRQAEQLIDKAAKEGDRGTSRPDAESRMTDKVHQHDGRKHGK